MKLRRVFHLRSQCFCGIVIYPILTFNIVKQHLTMLTGVIAFFSPALVPYVSQWVLLF